jgi:transcriptional regulator with XRE-family HTH domain
MLYDHTITGRIIREIREKKGLTQEVLSGLAAVSRSHLAEIESGRTNANVATLWRIAEALDMKLSDLIRIAEKTIEDRQS